MGFGGWPRDPGEAVDWVNSGPGSRVHQGARRTEDRAAVMLSLHAVGERPATEGWPEGPSIVGRSWSLPFGCWPLRAGSGGRANGVTGKHTPSDNKPV